MSSLLSSGPPLAKAWAENLGAKVGGFGFGGALLGALAAKMDQKILALTSLLLLRIFISIFRIFFKVLRAFFFVFVLSFFLVCGWVGGQREQLFRV